MADIITARYVFYGDPDEAEARAESLAVEQSHEFPRAYAPAVADRSLAHVVALRRTADDAVEASIAYPQELSAYEIPQLLVVLLGNGSLLPDLRLVGVDLPDKVLRALGGPRLGIRGVRDLVHADGQRALLATALKPVGLGVADLAEDAYRFARGGIDVIKDDQGLGNQVWAPFDERVPAVAQAVRRAVDETGVPSLYLPTFNPPAGQWDHAIELAVESGAHGFLVLPGVTGFDSVRYVRDHTPEDFVVYAHPAFLGGWTASRRHGIEPGLLFGELERLVGADAVIFPSFGGRFSLSERECRSIAAHARADIPGIRPALVSPGGGMNLERLPQLLECYGPDTLLLIGGALHADGDVESAARAFRAAATLD